ncbi:TerD family protein [Nocardia sp. NPDC049707]|uniref:TerD family protein n=1 Tax=Nocardia sp. NPDC049707 TaxID=3154735 RepID=UPI003427B1EB
MATLLMQGQTGVVGADDITVSVHHSARIDLAALLLDIQGRVHADTDLVFYNQPAAPGVRLIPGQAALAIDLRAVSSDVVHIRIVITLDDRTTRFDRYPPPHVTVTDSHAYPLCEYTIEGLTTETTVIALDADRTVAGWQVRAVGHGYGSGFAALLSAHGVTVGISPQQQPPPSMPSPSAPPMGPTLADGQDVALVKHGGTELTYVKMALGWDPVRVHGRWGSRAIEIDLDASALVFADRDLVDASYHGQLSTRDGAIRHSGDNLTGDGDGDDETIAVDLTRLPVHVTAVVFVITSYAGHTFERVRNAFWRLVDGTTNTELTRVNLRSGGPHTGMLVAKLHREHHTWKLQALGQPIQAGHPLEAINQISPYL